MTDRTLRLSIAIGAMSLTILAGATWLAQARTVTDLARQSAEECPPRACSIAFKTSRDGPPSVVIPIADATTPTATKEPRYQPKRVMTAWTVPPADTLR